MNKITKITNHITNLSLFAIIFIVPLYFAAFRETYDLFILNKQAIFHVLLAIGIISQLFYFFNNPKQLINYFQQNRTIILFIILISLSFIASTALSIHPQKSLWGSSARQEGLYSLINYNLFFILLIFYLNKNKWLKIKRLIIAALISSFFVCLYGLMQYFGFDFLVWKKMNFVFGRIISSLGQPNFLGHYLIIIIPLTIYSLFFIFKKFLTRFFILILIIMQMTCLIFSYSRAAWLGFLAGLILFLIFKKDVLYNIFLRKNKLLKLFLVICAFIILIFANSNLGFGQRLVSIFDTSTGTTKVRLLTWSSAINELKNMDTQRLLFGYGPETLQSIFAKHYKVEWAIYETINVYPDRAHNIILDSLLQFGVIYCYIIILFYHYILAQSLKFLKEKKDKLKDKEYWIIITCILILISYFINNLFSFSLIVTSIYLYLVLSILIVAIINDQAIKQSSNSTVTQLKCKARRLLICIILSLVVIYAVYIYDIKAIKADYYYMLAEKSNTSNNCDTTLHNIEKAIKNNPKSTFYKENYIKHSINCLDNLTNSRARYELSKKIVNVIMAINPSEYTLGTINNFAHAYSLLGVFVSPQYYELAYKEYDKIIKINPYFTTVYRDLAKMNLWQKKYDQAIINLNEFYKVIPPLSNHNLIRDHREEIESELLIGYKINGDIYSEIKEYDKADTYYNLALKIDPGNDEIRKKIKKIKLQISNTEN